jgi:DNA-binding NtrC family response regulator
LAVLGTDTTPHLLFVDDEPALRGLMAERLAERGFEVADAATGEKALELLEQFAFDVLVTDLRLPGIDGTRVIEAARERYPGIITIVITGYATVKDAVAIMKRGASDYVAKPFQFDELIHVLDKALEQRRLASENAYLRSQLEQRYHFGGILGRSQPMRELFHLLDTVAPANSTILITGETGTGKEVVARAIHHNSPRKAHRFVALNCSAIPESLLEAELFGHVRGAFTGAIGARQGRFEQAHKGTLFLDEVGTMSTALQMKLLRALQEREFERVGDSQTIKVDVRVIAATNSNLSSMVADGSFREDLYYRLNVITLDLPPLRARKDDIPPLVEHFLGKHRYSAKSDPARISQAALDVLADYPWPGNVRELENVIERAVIFAGGGVIGEEHINFSSAGGSVPVNVQRRLREGCGLDEIIEEVEKKAVREAMVLSGGDESSAAEMLKLPAKRMKQLLAPVDDEDL